MDEDQKKEAFSAVYFNDVARVERELNRGVDIEGEDSEGFTLLQRAAQYGSEAVAHLLAKRSANPDGRTATMRSTPLQLAINNGHYGIVRDLCLQDTDVELTDKQGDTALHIAAQCNRDDEAYFLIKQRTVNVTAKNDMGNTPLHYAAFHGHCSLIYTLLFSKAEAHREKNDYGDTPFNLACDNTKLDAMAMLIKHGADVEIVNQGGKTPLENAVEESEIYVAAVIQRAIVTAANVNKEDPLRYITVFPDMRHNEMLPFVKPVE